MFSSTEKQRPKPPCPICQMIRRTLFLAIGLGVFAYYAYSPEQRSSESVGALLEYVTIANATVALFIAIAGKLVFDAVKHFLHKK